MKILLLGDASNYHNALAYGLVRAGHDVTLASSGSQWMNTERNIDISRGKGKIKGALLWLKLNTLLASQLKGYDVVQLCGPIFLDLKPQRVRQIFKRLRRNNGHVFMSALSTNSEYVRMCLAEDSPLKYSDWAINGEIGAMHDPRIREAWLSPLLTDHCRFIVENVDGVVSALYEYHLAYQRVIEPERLAYAGIPIVMPEQASALSQDGRVRVMLACHKGREKEKGADLMLPVLQELQNRNPSRVQFDFVQNVPFSQFQQKLSQADIVVDQLYSYTPATTALMAMARGKVTVSGGEPEYYDFIGEKDIRPIINADPCNLMSLADSLQSLVSDTERLAQLGAASREFVAKHNSADVVAARFLDFWQKRM